MALVPIIWPGPLSSDLLKYFPVWLHLIIILLLQSTSISALAKTRSFKCIYFVHLRFVYFVHLFEHGSRGLSCRIAQISQACGHCSLAARLFSRAAARVLLHEHEPPHSGLKLEFLEYSLANTYMHTRHFSRTTRSRSLCLIYGAFGTSLSVYCVLYTLVSPQPFALCNCCVPSS